MSISLKFLSAVIRKADIASHYPGGCPAFESRNLTGAEDTNLYLIYAMSGSELSEIVEEIHASGFDTDRFVAIGDMWYGPVRQVSSIRFYPDSLESIPPIWHVECAQEDDHA